MLRSAEVDFDEVPRRARGKWRAETGPPARRPRAMPPKQQRRKGRGHWARALFGRLERKVYQGSEDFRVRGDLHPG